MRGLSIIIPCYKENINKVIKEAQHQVNELKIDYIRSIHEVDYPNTYDHWRKIPVELVIVDDGYNLKTKLPKGKRGMTYKYIKNEKNMGKGYSVRRGLLDSRYDTKLVVDADLSVGIDELLYLRNKAINPDNPKPFLFVGERRYIKKTSMTRRVLSFAHKCLIKALFDLPVWDTQCPFKCFNRIPKRILRALSVNGFEYDVEAIQEVHGAGIDIFKERIDFYHDDRSTVNAETPKKMLREIIDLKKKKKVE